MVRLPLITPYKSLNPSHYSRRTRYQLILLTCPLKFLSGHFTSGCSTTTSIRTFNFGSGRRASFQFAFRSSDLMGSLDINHMSTAGETGRPRPTFSRSEPRDIYRTARAFKHQFDDESSASGNRKPACTRLSASSSSTPSKSSKQNSKSISSLSAEEISAQETNPTHDSDSNDEGFLSPTRILFRAVAGHAKSAWNPHMGTGDHSIKTPPHAILSLSPATATLALPHARTGLAERAAKEDTRHSVNINTGLDVSSGYGASD